jgi:hypothetical protein
MEVDLFGLGDGHVLDEQARHALALALGRRRVRPQRREVGGE